MHIYIYKINALRAECQFEEGDDEQTLLNKRKEGSNKAEQSFDFR